MLGSERNGNHSSDHGEGCHQDGPQTACCAVHGGCAGGMPMLGRKRPRWDSGYARCFRVCSNTAAAELFRERLAMLRRDPIDQRSANDLVRGVRLEHGEPGGVHLDQPARFVDHLDALGLRLEQRPQLRREVASGLLGARPCSPPADRDLPAAGCRESFATGTPPARSRSAAPPPCSPPGSAASRRRRSTSAAD